MFDKEKLRQDLARFLKQSVSKCGDSVVLTNLVSESFVLIEMAIHLQEKTGIRLVQEDLKSVQTIGDLISVFAKKSGG